MIKKPPSFTGNIDEDGNPEMSSGEEPEAAAIHDPDHGGHGSNKIDDEFASAEDDLDFDQDPVAAGSKKSSAFITYGIGFLMLCGIGFLAYHQLNPSKKQNAETRTIVPIPSSFNTPYSQQTQASAPQEKPSTNVVDSTPAGMEQGKEASPPAADTSLPYVGPVNNAPTTTADSGQGNQGAPVTAIIPTGPETPVATKPESTDTRVAALSAKVDELQAIISTLNQKTTDQATSLQSLQTKLDGLQTQIAQSSMKIQGGGLAAKVAKPVEHSAVKAEPQTSNSASTTPYQGSGNSAQWTLRSATPGAALIVKSGSNEFQSVAIGDNVPGIGQVKSIDQANGRWVVRGTNGSIGQ